jgi:hypothetical protein
MAILMHLLTAVLVGLKVSGFAAAEYSWLVAFSPSLIVFGIAIMCVAVALIVAAAANK